MPRTLGIDIRKNQLRVALVRTSYRRVAVEALAEVELADYESLEQALRVVAAPFLQHHEGLVMALPGDQAYIHRVSLPPAALKEVESVLPFELEAQIPVDFDELVFDSRVLPRDKNSDSVEVLAAAAQRTQVQALILLARESLGHEPERIAVGPLPLGNLESVCPELRSDRYVALVDLGDEHSEVIIVTQGVTVFARTLSVGVAGLPGNAADLVAVLKQTIVSWSVACEHPVEVVYLCGGGALAGGIAQYLTAQVGVPVEALPALSFDEVQPEYVAELPRFAKALGIALSMRAGHKDLNLRQGDLAYQRGYGFLREKLPLAVAFAAILVVSFVFSAWAESHALTKENEALRSAMTTLSKQILEEETDDAERVLELLDSRGKTEKDPQPELDAFDLVVALAEHIPENVQHDVDELELQRDAVKLRGIVQATEDAQKIADAFSAQPCFQNVNILKITAVPNKPLQKYSMEFDMRCKDKSPPKKATDAEEEG